jgi:Ribonuclease HepT-like
MPPDQSGESWRAAGLLLDMALAAEDALSFVARLDERGFLASDVYQSAVIRKLEVIVEAAGRVSKSFRTAHAEIPWRENRPAPSPHSRLRRRTARYRVARGDRHVAWPRRYLASIDSSESRS